MDNSRHISSAKTATPWLHRFAWLTALATLGLIAIGGLVTSQGVGMAVPDWPTTYGYNMFLFPISIWAGGIFYEHTHRLVATVVGVLVVALTRWLGGRGACRPLLIIGLIELIAGYALLGISPNLKGAGYFLSGIGGVVLLAGMVWLRNQPAARPLPTLGWLAFTLVQLQGLLGGLRVVLVDDRIGIFHAALAQMFFVQLCAIVLLTSRWWRGLAEKADPLNPPTHESSPSPPEERRGRGQGRGGASSSAVHGEGLFDSISSLKSTAVVRWWFLGGTLLIFCQLILGATMRHQHAGLAIPDFPLAYHKLWPPMDAAAVARYNQLRLDSRDFNPITAFQIGLQMAHRLTALAILAVLAWCAWKARQQRPLAKLSVAWLALIFLQILLGAATIWYNKPADIATAHVLVGALSLVTGALLTIVSFRVLIPVRVALAPLPDTIRSPVVSPKPAASGAK